jgi:DNA mismatch repair ATPase MutS
MPQGVAHRARRSKLAGSWEARGRGGGAKRAFIFPIRLVEEQLAKGTGRFGDEAQRLQQIFAQGIRYRLILLNEPLVSTNPGESLYIAQDIVHILRLLGARAIFATHLHELVANMATLNISTDGVSHIVRQVVSRMGIGENGLYRSYKIALAPR